MGGGQLQVKADPNLTPLLDIVLQLLMFFMMCVNFISEQVNQTIVLPQSQSALPIDKSKVDVIFLNLTADGKVLIVGEEPKDLEQMEGWLTDKYRFAQRVAGTTGPINTAVVIRAHRDADYRMIYHLLRYCSASGYTDLRLRALTFNPLGV